MNERTKWIFILYVCASVANVGGHILGAEVVVLYSKPLLVPLLLALVYFWADGHVTLSRLLLALALILSWIGDVLLMYADQELLFLGGLVSFFFGQITYAMILFRSADRKPTFSFLKALPFVLYMGGFGYALVPYVGDFLLPLGIYATGITGMAIIAAHRQNLTNQLSYIQALTGAVLFMISDSIIAFDRFVEPVTLSGVWVMSTYTLAQYFLVSGIMRHAIIIGSGEKKHVPKPRRYGK